MENGTEGDVVNVLNLQSKRTVTGTVIGRGQVAISVAAPRPPAIADADSSLPADQTSSIQPDQAARPVAVATTTPPAAPKTE